VDKVIWHKAASTPDTDGSFVFAWWGANVHRRCGKPKNVCLGNVPYCSVLAISAFCWQTTQTLSI